MCMQFLSFVIKVKTQCISLYTAATKVMYMYVSNEGPLKSQVFVPMLF